MDRHPAKSVRPLLSSEERVPDQVVGQEQVEGAGGVRGADDGIAVGEETFMDGEPARNPKIMRRPVMPTKAMVLAHELHHADYRDWCDHCVAGKGVAHQHVSTDKETLNVEFSIDYAFMTLAGKLDLERELAKEKLKGAPPVLL